MKIALSTLLLFHGPIHFMGFAKAFNIGNLLRFTKEISKPVGLFWQLAGWLFIVSAMLVLMKKGAWPMLAVLALVTSQILIFMVWQVAKFGTITNMVIFLVCISAHGCYRFSKMVQTEAAQLGQTINVINLPVIMKGATDHLPEIVKKWIQNSGAVGKDKIVSVHLKQKGEMRTKPQGKWMPFKATQFFNVDRTAFI